MPPFIDSLIVLAVVLIVARFIKRGSKTLQRFFIPSSLVAGVGALILGPQIFGTIPAEVTDYWVKLPKYLINIVFAGLFLGKYIPSRKEIWRHAGPMIAFGNTMAWGQYVVGCLLALVLLVPVFNANPLSASLIEISFAGGHGTAAGLAPTFQKLGWSDGTDVALALATLSIVTAVVSGIIFINLHHRRRNSTITDAEIQAQQKQMIRSGYDLIRLSEKINNKPKAITVNVIAFIMAIGIGWVILQSLIWLENAVLNGYTDMRFFKYVPLFPLAMIGGLIIQLILKKMHKQRFIQRRTAETISAIALDLLIASAIATVSLSVVQNNLPTFITLGIAGIVFIVACLFLLAPRIFSTNWFEWGVSDYGQAMGMTATGLLMNRLADPSNKLKIKESFAYKQLLFEPFMGGGIVTAAAVIFMFEFGLVPVFIVSLFSFLFWLILGLHMGKRRKPIKA